MKEVFYAGRLRPFKHVGQHPQFEHIHIPPPGYRFTTSGPIQVANYVRVMRSIVKLSRDSLTNGSTVKDLFRFIDSRSVRAQMCLPAADLVFLPSTPFILGQAPWVIEIEDTTTLFAPFPRVQGKRVNPRLLGLDGVYDSGFYPAVKALLESDNCRGIICHVASTANSIPILFKNPKLAEKISHIPLGIAPRPERDSSVREEVITLLFTNSWHQGATGFYLRGGLDLLEAYSKLHSEHPRIRLIIRSKLPDDLDHRYRRIIKQCNVEVIDRFLPVNEIEALFSSADIYVLPSARLHVVSILQAMAYSLAIVASDGWGIKEYIDDGRNGLIVPGRYGTCSWMDNNGMLKEDYRPLLSANVTFANALTDALSTLINDKEMRRHLGQTGRRDVEAKFSIQQWNSGLANAFNRALARVAE
jgi:glycosyltransferase involved in cell wall biosynthesis